MFQPLEATREAGARTEKIVKTATPGQIASVTGADSATVQVLFAATVAHWRASGVRVAGLLAEPDGPPGRTCTAGVLRDIASGRAFQIYFDDTAPGGMMCDLDASGVEAACAGLLGQLTTCDVVVLSKFGKLEAARSGLITAFQAVINAGTPLLTSVSSKHREAWKAFVPAAIELPAEAAAIQGWWRDLQARAGPTG